MLKEEEKKTFLVDATPVDLDFNFHRNKKTKEYLKTLNLEWSYSSSKGFYIGFKATVVMGYMNYLNFTDTLYLPQSIIYIPTDLL